MVHYIRYLRVPQVSNVSKKTLEITAVVTVTTDLGDSFFSQDVTLMVRVVDATKNGEILCATEVHWKSGARAAKINIECNVKHFGRLVDLHVTTRDTIAAQISCKLPPIVDIWSQSFTVKTKSKADPLVQRRLPLYGKSTARLWEETGDSIARHIWDASFGCLIHLNSCFDDTQQDSLPLLRKLLTSNTSKRLRVLEVGSGCGVVGIALSQLRKCEVLLTDLEDAQDIMQTNIDYAIPSPGSILERQVLEWGKGLDDLENAKFDLVLVSDCIYNPDSSILLVQTLQKISDRNPKVLIFVAFKRRHDADDIFFENMQKSELVVAEQDAIMLPHSMTNYDTHEPRIEAFVYSRNGGVS